MASIQRWWRMLKKNHYPKANRLLICADAGGGNGNRSRGWRFYLQEFADMIGIPITAITREEPANGTGLSTACSHLSA